MASNTPQPDNPGTSISISQKTLMQAAVFALAGALGGGGVSIASAPNDELSSLKNSVDVVALTLQEIKSDLKYASSERVRLQETIKDIEQRLRNREKCGCSE